MNNNEKINCKKLYQFRSNNLSYLASKINKTQKDSPRISAFMMGMKKATVIVDRKNYEFSSYQSAHEFLSKHLN